MRGKEAFHGTGFRILNASSLPAFRPDVEENGTRLATILNERLICVSLIHGGHLVVVMSKGASNHGT